MLIVIKELSYHPYRRAKRYQIQLEFKRNKFNQKGHHESFRFLRKIIKKKNNHAGNAVLLAYTDKEKNKQTCESDELVAPNL